MLSYNKINNLLRSIVFDRRFGRLVRRALLSEVELAQIRDEADRSGFYVEDLFLRRGIPKHELLLCLAEFYHLPFVEYDEDLMVSPKILSRIDSERLKTALWFPLAVVDGKAEVIACRPDDPQVLEDIRETLGVEEVEFLVALPRDLIRIIENNQDLNPGFPPSAGRTPLALVRTFLAERRSLFATQRTSLAKGRTGLAFLRTGIAFIAIAVTLLRVFGLGLPSIAGIVLLAFGIAAVYDGFKWYLPIRRNALQKLDYASGQSSDGVTVLKVSNPGDNPVFTRSGAVGGAEELRRGWNGLSPVQRRRFLANDRTDLAEERTVLASLRTTMAKARTGLAFARTGIAFAGLGIALFRHFHSSGWTVFDGSLILFGVLMFVEGAWWYFPGRAAGRRGLKLTKEAETARSIWDSVFPPFYKSDDAGVCVPPVRLSHKPGIWATTGLALERTILADRRNVMARLRTVMARARTAMAFIRTGLSIGAVGTGLLVYFGVGNFTWAVFEILLIIAGLLLIADGLFWYVPAEKLKCQLPYCFGDMEIFMPDYRVPARQWKKVVFSHGGH
jgi:uncharacterized membrane protein YidH (DUF202 family)